MPARRAHAATRVSSLCCGVGPRAQLELERWYHAPAAFRTSSISFRTVFQFRAELTTPMPLSNFSASFDLPNPSGVGGVSLPLRSPVFHREIEVGEQAHPSVFPACFGRATVARHHPGVCR